MILPVPDDAPPAIPRLRISDSDGRWACQITTNRIDFFFESRAKHGHEAALEDVVESHFELTCNVWDQLQEHFGAKAHRIGFVSRLGATAKDTNLLLREAFLRTDSFDASDRLEIHALHKTKIGEYAVNRWVRLRAFPPPSDEEDGRLQMEVDINTLPEHAVDLSVEATNQFLESALDLLNQTRSSFAAHLSGG
jgi:hypothetical protein